MEVGSCQLPSAGRTRPPRTSPRTQRFASRRCLSHETHKWRPHPPPTHQHQSLSTARVDHHPELRRDRITIRKNDWSSATTECKRILESLPPNHQSRASTRRQPLALRRFHAPLPQRHEGRRPIPAKLPNATLGISCAFDVGCVHGFFQSCSITRSIRSRADLPHFKRRHDPARALTTSHPGKNGWLSFNQRELTRHFQPSQQGSTSASNVEAAG